MNHGPEKDQAGEQSNTSPPIFPVSSFLVLPSISSRTLHHPPVSLTQTVNPVLFPLLRLVPVENHRFSFTVHLNANVYLPPSPSSHRSSKPSSFLLTGSTPYCMVHRFYRAALLFSSLTTQHHLLPFLQGSHHFCQNEELSHGALFSACLRHFD